MDGSSIILRWVDKKKNEITRVWRMIQHLMKSVRCYELRKGSLSVGMVCHRQPGKGRRYLFFFTLATYVFGQFGRASERGVFSPSYPLILPVSFFVLVDKKGNI